MRKIIINTFVIFVLSLVSVQGQTQKDRYEVELATFNSAASDFGVGLNKDEIIYASNRDSSVVLNRRYLHDGKRLPFYQLFSSKAGDSTSLRIEKSINKKYHESTVAVTNDGKTLYFTRSNFYKGLFKTDEEGTNRLKIFKATKTGNGWSNIVELPFNSDQYSVAHPTLNKDNSRLYFASDMDGTIGLSDIFYVTLEGSNGYGTPTNLGDKINTAGNDTFPFMSKKGDLYFSSDGHPGSGGLDVFVSQAIEDYNVIHNVGSPVNTEADDFAFAIDDDTKKGFFTSNRTNGVGDDDIYTLEEKEPIFTPCDGVVSGTVKDKKGAILSGAAVVLTDNDGKELSRTMSSADGGFKFNIDCADKDFILDGTKQEYKDDKERVSATRTNKNPTAELVLERIAPVGPAKPDISVGTDLMKLLNLNPIYFDLNKSNIRPDAAIELQKVITYMKEYPTIKVEVRSHTDSRGSDKYNLSLSDRRAKSTARYIEQNGSISTFRISGNGYGESSLNNHCKNGVKCSKAEHQLNRRSEFIVISK